jgi:flagellar hook-associated protein 2
MVSRITLGNFVTNKDGKTTLNGSQSGLDTASIVNSLVEARRQPAVKLENTNKTLASKQTALKDLQTILTKFKTAADNLRNPPGVQNASKNIFEYRTSALSATGGFAASNYLGITVEPGATAQSFNVTNIQQLAKETRQETGVFLLPDTTTASAVSGAPAPGLFTAGTFSLRTIDGSAAPNITLNAGESLQTVANKFNEVSNRTGISANIIKVASGVPDNSYKIIFTATKTGLTTGFDLNNPATVSANPNDVFGNVAVSTTQPAQDARFFIDGIQIDRESNNINDVFTGITFNLKQANAGITSINVAVQPDTEIVKSAITAFVDAYNEFRLFAAKQTELGDDGLPVEGALLTNDNTLRTVSSQIGGEMSRVVAGISDNDPSRLADIGLSFDTFAGDDENPQTRNILTIDSDKLASALAADFDGVRGVFEYRLKSDNTQLTTFARTNALNISSFQLTIDRTNNIYRADYLDENNVAQQVFLDGTAISGGGVSLAGQKGTVLEGLQLLYSTAGDAFINVTVSQGIGDRGYNALNSMLNDDSGLLTNAITTLDDQQKSNEDEITKIEDRLVSYRAQLEAQYSALEEALSKANNLLQLLQAQSDARNNS